MLRVVQFTTARHREVGDGGVITEWYRKELSASARAEFDNLLRDLGKLRAKDWNAKDYAALTGKHAGIWELRFKADKKEYRPLGFILPQAEVGGADCDILALLIGAYKKMGIWTPRDARDTAVERKAWVIGNRSLLHDYKY